MPKPRCPGQDSRFWKPEDIFEMKCPYCSNDMEFFKDEPMLICSSCGKEVRNTKIDLGCAKWCKYADECIGTLLEDDMTTSMCERLQAEMQALLADDQKRINHALRVLAYAEKINEQVDADALTIKAAAILHDIGIHEAERKYGSPAGNYQEIEGPPIARKIMEKLELDKNIIDHVCKIIGSHHSAKDIDTPEFRVIWDADWMVNMKDELLHKSKDELEHLIDKIFKTPRGNELARKEFL